MTLLSKGLCKVLLRFRTRNHKLPVETGRWNSIPLQERKCTFCTEDLGDEYHYIMTCRQFKAQRFKYINKYFYQNPNILKFKQLMNSENITELNNLCYFIQEINRIIWDVTIICLLITYCQVTYIYCTKNYIQWTRGILAALNWRGTSPKTCSQRWFDALPASRVQWTVIIELTHNVNLFRPGMHFFWYYAPGQPRSDAAFQTS